MPILHMTLVHVKENRRKKFNNSNNKKYENWSQCAKVCFPFHIHKMIEVGPLMKILLCTKPIPIIGLAHQHKNTKEDAYTYLESHALNNSTVIKKTKYFFVYTFNKLQITTTQASFVALLKSFCKLK